MNLYHCITHFRPTTIQRGIKESVQLNNIKSNTKHAVPYTSLVLNCNLSFKIESIQSSNKNKILPSNKKCPTLKLQPINTSHTRPLAIFRAPKDISNLLNHGTKCTHCRMFSTSSVRHNSTQSTKIHKSTLADTNDSNIPSSHDSGATQNLTENVSPISNIEDLANVIEPSYQSLGLAHWWPSGIMQAIMESIHLNLDLNWSGTIILTTVIARTFIFPLLLYDKKSSIRTNHNLPELQRLEGLWKHSRKANKSKKEQNKALNDYKEFAKEKGIKGPMIWIVPRVIDGIIFISMSFALRGMTRCPVESMKDQGIGWFSDLTVCDPLSILPVLLSTLLALNLRLIATSDPTGITRILDQGQYYMMKYGITMKSFTIPAIRIKAYEKQQYVIPLLLFPAALKIPTAVVLYWVTTSLCTLIQEYLLRNHVTMKILGLEKLKVWRDDELPFKNSKLLPDAGKNIQNFGLDEVLKKSAVKRKKV